MAEDIKPERKAAANGEQPPEAANGDITDIEIISAESGDIPGHGKNPRGGAARLFKLFWIMFRISAVTLGGGYAIVAIMEREFCEKLGWLNEREMLDFTAIAQSSTGSIAINAAMLVGRRVAGWVGAAVAVFGAVLPPFITMTLIAYFYGFVNNTPVIRWALLGMQAATAAVIANAAVTLAASVWREGRIFAASIAGLSFILVAFTPVSSAFVIIGAAFAGIGFIAARGGSAG